MEAGMKGKSKDKTTLVLGIIVSLAVLVTMVFYLSGGFNVGSLSTTVIVFVIVGLAIFVIFGKIKSIKRGLPAQDEMSKKTMQKAGYYAWLVTIYIALAASYFSDEIGIIGRHVGFIILIGSAITFFVFYLWFSRRGDV
jgi:hypothetical protein